MNKKAFTLAEILGVIVVIGLLLLIIAPTIINRVNSKKENVEEAANKIIYDAASQYITENREHFPQGKKYCIKLTDLIEAGKLASPVKDVKTGKNIENTYTVEVSLYSSGDSYYELRENPDCDSNLPMIDFEVDPSNKIWAREKNVIILYPEGGSDQTYKKDNDGFTGYSQPIVFNKNGILEAQMKYKGTVIRSKINIVKIDSAPPTCNGQTGGKTNWTKNQNVTVGAKCKDNESGCTQNTFTSTINGHGKTEEKTITIRDKVGNTRNCEYTYNKYIDAVAPTCNGQTGGKTDWTKNQNVTVGAKCKDNESGCTQNTFTTTINGHGKTEEKTITIKDKVGNTNNCTHTYNKYIDTVAPSCNGQFGGKTNWTKNQNVTVGAYCKDNDSGCGQNQYTSTISGNGKTQSKTITIKDKAGNTNNCEHTYDKYIDTVAPKIFGPYYECATPDCTSLDSGGYHFYIKIYFYDELSGVSYRYIYAHDPGLSVSHIWYSPEYNMTCSYNSQPIPCGNDMNADRPGSGVDEFTVDTFIVRDRAGNEASFHNRVCRSSTRSC